MTTEQLNEIRARAEAATELLNELHTERLAYGEYLQLIDSNQDIPLLLSEVERLTAERDSLATRSEALEATLTERNAWIANIEKQLDQALAGRG